MIKEIHNKCVRIIRNKEIILTIAILIIIVILTTGSIQKEETGINDTLEVISQLNIEKINNDIQENINTTIDNYLKEYSTYYNLDGNKVVEFARNITNNYAINLNEVGGRIKSNTNEGQAMMFVYYLSRDELSKSLNEYSTSKSYFETEKIKTIMDENEMLRSGLTFSQFLGKVCDNLGMDKNYLLSISYLETGKNTSGLSRRSNNFGGLRSSGEYFSYDTPEMGIIAYVINLKGYEKYNLNSIYELSGIYTHGSVYNPSESWVSKVYKYYDDIVNNQAQYFIIEDV